MPVGKEGKWVPDARIWNMNEGSFDQREIIYAPTPSKMTFRVKVPMNARLQMNPALIRDVQGTTAFKVLAMDARGVEKQIWQQRIQTGDARKWFDASVDLGEYGGQEIELTLQTTLEKPEGGERPWVTPPDPPPPRPGDEDDGKPKPPPVPTMSLAMWGSPVITAKARTQTPYNVLFVVIDALRPDVLASFHDDAEDEKKRKAKYPPLDALLPKVPGLTANMDALAAKGVRFTNAYSAAAWTRPGTLAMLAGKRSSELGVDTYSWMVPPAQITPFYGSDPPLLSLLLRKNGVTTTAFVNNFFMVGYAAVGLDFGFERVHDHRYRTRDTEEIANSAIQWLKQNRDQRFFMFANFNSPHDPYDPLPHHRKMIPKPPVGPKDAMVADYMAEAGKDDEAIGAILRTLDELKLRDKTLVIVTSDHGETLSAAHGGTSALDKMAVRFHHAAGNFEETTRIPIIMHLPGVLEGGKEVKARVRSLDLAPTVLDVLGMEPNPRMAGKSVMSLVRGEKEEERVVVSEGRMQRAIMHGKYRLLVREGQAQYTGGYGNGRLTEELFDLEEDPGERHNIAAELPDVVEELKARMRAALDNVPVSGTPEPAKKEEVPALHVRFAGSGKARRVSGNLVFGKGTNVSVSFEPVGVPRESFKLDGSKLELAFTTVPDAVVGVDVKVTPQGAPVAWNLYLDDKPWPEGLLFTGPFGLAAHSAKTGITSEEARFEVYSPALPFIDPARDLGVFITRDRRGETTERVATGGEAAKEMDRVLKEWGYAHGSADKK
jgi:arylsulfatase A-like enzyme